MRSIRLQLLVTLMAAGVAAGMLASRGLPPGNSVGDAMLDFDAIGARRHVRWATSLEYLYRGGSPMNLAVIARDEATVRELLATGDHLNYRACPLGFSPLHCAVHTGQLDMAVLLIDRGAQVDMPDPGGLQPLHCAAMVGNIEMASLLIDRGADLNARDNEGRTPLAWARFHSQRKAASYFLQCGAKE